VTGRRAVLVVAGVLFLWGIVLLATGGFVVETPWGRLSSRAPVRPFVLGTLVLLFYFTRWRRHWRTDIAALDRIRPEPALAGLAVVLSLAIGLIWGTRIAEGPDASAYVSQAALLARGELTTTAPVWARDAPWAEAVSTAAPSGYAEGTRPGRRHERQWDDVRADEDRHSGGDARRQQMATPCRDQGQRPERCGRHVAHGLDDHHEKCRTHGDEPRSRCASPPASDVTRRLEPRAVRQLVFRVADACAAPRPFRAAVLNTSGRGRILLVTTMFPIALVALYLPHLVLGIDDWPYLRLLLPAYPPLMIGLAIVAGAAAHRIRVAWARAAAVVTIVAAVAVHGWEFAAASGVSAIRHTDTRYGRTAEYVKQLPPRSIIVSRVHSGTIHFYTGRDVLQFERLSPDQMDTAVFHLRDAGYQLYLVGDDLEIEMFRRMTNGTRTGMLLDRVLGIDVGGAFVYWLDDGYRDGAR
jgi:hypothetical protein